MFTYRVEIPEKGTFRVESPELLSDEQAYEAALTLAPPEQTVFGQVKESLKAIPRGAVGLLETGITGAAALLPEEYEKPVVAKAQELAKRFSPQVAPGYEDSPFVKIGEGLGSMITPIGIPGVVGKTLLLGAAGAGEARQRAQQAETTPEQISTATAEGIIPGLTDLLPLRYLMGAYGKVALNGMMSRATRMAATGGLEGAQEAAQNIMQNAIAQGYDPSQGLYEGTGESATYGGAVGAIAQGLIDAVLPGRARRGAQPPRESERIQSEEPPVTDSEIPLVQPGAAALKIPLVQPGAAAPEIPLVQPGAAPVAAPVAAPEKMSRWNEFLKTDPNKEALEARLEAVNQRLVWEEAQPKQNKFVINALKTQRDTKIPEALEQLKREVVPADILKPTLRKPKVKLDAAPTGPTEVKAERPRTGAEQFVLSDATEKPDVEETVDVGVGGAKSTARGPAGGTETQSGALEKAAADVPISGFKTEKGSRYSINELGKTSRTKLSKGKGQGTTYEPHAALYVASENAQNILEDMRSGALTGGNSIRLGYIDLKNNVFKTVTDTAQIPAGVEAVVGVVDKNTNQLINSYKAQLTPAVGLAPVEKLYTPDGMTNTHLGNKIVEVFGQPKTPDKKAEGLPSAVEQTPAPAPAPAPAKPVKNQINKAKLEKAGEGERVPLSQTPLTSQQQKVADELVQVNKAPKAVQDYVKHYKGVDKAIPMVGFDTGYGNIKKGEMGYPQEGGAAARAFAKWIKVNGTSEQKNTLAKNQAEYARLKTKAEDKTLVAARETPQELRLASVKQTEDENAKDKFEADQTKLKTKKPKDVVKARNQIIEDRAGTPYIEETDEDQDAAFRRAMRFSKNGTAGLEVTANERTGNLEVSLDGKVIHTQSFANPKLLANFKGDALERMVKERSRAAQNSEEFKNKLEELREQTPLNSYEFRFKAITDAAAGYEYGNNYANLVMENSDGGTIRNIRPSLRDYQASPAAIAQNKKLNQKQIAENIIEAGRFGARSSKGETTTATGNTKEGVTKALKNYFKENSRFDALTTVVQSESELPEEVKRAEDYAPGVRGVAHRGKVWIVADNIEPGKELGVFLHEAGAHIGFDNILKPSDRQFLADQVRKWAKGNNDLVETRAAKVALEKGGKSNDEIIAYMVEELVNKNVKPTSFRPASTWLRRVLDAFKKAINKLDFRRDITPQELVDAANGAAHIAMKGSGTASYIAPRFSVSNPAMAAVSARTLKLVSGPPAPQNIVQRAYQTALHPEPKRFFQNLRQNFANKNTLWEDWFSSLHGNNALDTAGAASALDRLQASTKIGGIQLATLEKGGFRKGTNKLWEAYDTDASYQDIVEQVNQMVGKYDETPDFDSAQDMFNLAATAKREEGLIASKQTTDTGGEIDRTLDDAQLREGLTIFNSTPEIQNALNLYKKFNDRNVDTLVTAGIIDAATAVELKGNAGYVPWFRFVEDADGNINFKAVKAFSKGLITLSEMQNLKGVKIEDIQIGNILDNMAKLSNWMVNKSIGNDTAAFMIDFAIPYGQAKKVGGPSKNTVQIMRNGEDTYYELSDPAALAAFRGYEAAQGAIVSVLKSPANLLRKTITLNPVFSLTQLPQDSFRAFISGGLKNPYAIFPRVMSNFAKGFFSPSETAKELYKYGIRGISSGLPTEASENIRRKLGYYDKGAGGVWTQFVDGLERISAASDEAVRTALYELTLEEGGSQVMALRRAREIINFDTQGAGATSSFFRQTVPFMGVWMNDLNNLYKGLVLGSARLSEGEQAATRAAIVYRGMQVAALTVLYTLMVGDDDDYKKLNDDVRNRSLILPGTGVRIPIPNDGIGFLFKVIPEEVTRMVMAEGIESDDAGAKMGRALWNGLTNVGSFENIIPVVGSPLAKTFVELTLNKSFYTGNPVVGKSKENLEPENQYTESTSEIAKQLGAALNISPIKLDYLVRGLTAQVGGSVLAVSNSLFHAASGKVTPSWSGDIKDIPLLGAFGYSRKDKSDLEDYYELRHVVDKVSRTYKDMISAGRGKEAIEYITDPTNQKAYALRKLQSRIDDDLAKYRKLEKLIYSNQNLTSEEMRLQLNKLDELRTKYLQSLRLPKLRAFAEISPVFDSSVLKILR